MLLSNAQRWALAGGRVLRRVADESGASLAEYGLVLSLVALIAFGALALVGGAATNLLTHAGSAVAHP